MSDVVVKGLVLQCADYRESSRMLTVLTDRFGKISVSAKGARRKNSRIAPSCQPFAFSEMVLNETRGRYYLSEASVIELFSGLANDIGNYSLGAYFLDLLNAACPEEDDMHELLALGLNALWLLCEGVKPREQVKTVFELRLMLLLGYCPDIEACTVCGKENPVEPILDLRGGNLYCRGCSVGKVEKPYRIDQTILHAMNYISNSKSGKEFSFTLTEKPLKRLSMATELYIQEQLERNFSTLDFYKQTK